MTLASRTDQRALVAVAAQFFVNGAVVASYIPRLPEIRESIQITNSQIGLALSIAGLVGLGGSAATSRLIGAFGTKHVVLVGGVCLSVSLFAVGNAPSYLLLLVALSMLMVCDVCVDVAMNLQASWLSDRRHAPVMNRLHGLWSFGTLVGGFVSARMAAAGVSLQAHAAIVAVVLCFVVVAVSRWLLVIDEVGEADAMGRDGEVRRRPYLLAGFALLGCFAVVLESGANDWATFRMTDDFAKTAGQAALGYVAVSVGMTSGRFVGDSIAVRLGPSRHLLGSCGVTLIGLVLATTIDQSEIALIGLGLIGLGVAALLPTVYDQAAKHPGRTGAGLGALTAGIRIGVLATPLFIGTVSETSASVGSSMLILMAPAVIGFVVVDNRVANSRNAIPG